MCFLLFLDNFYGTPKPPAEPTPMLFNVTDQLLPGARPSAEGKRKRNKSVSNMEKDSIEPPEEDEEESPIVNGNGIAITPGYNLLLLNWPDWVNYECGLHCRFDSFLMKDISDQSLMLYLNFSVVM